MPQMVQKFYAVKDESVIKIAALITFLFSIIITFSAYFTGAMDAEGNCEVAYNI